MSTNNQPPADDIYAIILAAGESKRLGEPKQLLSFQNKTLIKHVADNIYAVFENQFRIVLGAHQATIEPEIAAYQSMAVTNEHWQEGMASSIRAGIKSLPKSAQAVMVVLVDQALITTQHLAMLLEQWRKHRDQRIASIYNDIIGVPAIFPKHDFSELLELSGDKGARQLLIHKHNTICVSIPEASIDIDTQTDYKNLINRRVVTNERLLP